MPEGNLTIEYIEPAQDPRWDRFVLSHPFGWLTHLSSWQKILEISFAHMKGYYPALVERYSGGIVAALPIFEVRSWLTGRKLVSIPWATLSDPLVSCKEEFDLLFSETQALMKSLGSAHLEIRSLQTSALIDDGVPTERPVFMHHYLSLDQGIEKLKSSFHRTCVQQRIKRAYDSNLTLCTGNSIEHLNILYSMHLANRKQKGLPPHPYRFFKNMWEVLHPENKISLLIAKHKGEPIATLLLFKFKGRISAEFAQIDNSYRSMSPNIFLFWEAIKLGVQENYQTFDFGRTPPANQSLVDFKSRWGTSVSNLYCYYYPAVTGNGLVSMHSRRYKLLNLLCKYTPMCIQPYIGEFCYRHAG
jgi:hypothetical protein